MSKPLILIGAALALGLIGVGAVLWWQASLPEPPSVAPVAVEPPPAPQSVTAEPAVQYPIEAASAAQASTVPLDFADTLTDLFGSKAVLSMFQTQDFARRFVATVDNLGRAHAAAQLWPVNPAGGRFIVEQRDGITTISPDNGMRYTPYLLLIETVDMRQVAAAYVRLYPLFQQAYEALGYPRRHFNGRMVAVIDHLLATPHEDGPLAVRLPAINGPIQPERPWVLYEFEDPALESLSAGQKILLRMGPVNQRRVKAKLAEFRQLVAGGVTPR